MAARGKELRTLTVRSAPRTRPCGSISMAQIGQSVLVADETNARDEGWPTLVLVTGLPGTGKSRVAEAAAEALGAAVLGHDWAMSGLRPYQELQDVLDAMEPSGHRVVGWSILNALAAAQLRAGRSVVLDGVARRSEIAACREKAQREDSRFMMIATNVRIVPSTDLGLRGVNAPSPTGTRLVGAASSARCTCGNNPNTLISTSMPPTPGTPMPPCWHRFSAEVGDARLPARKVGSGGQFSSMDALVRQTQAGVVEGPPRYDPSGEPLPRRLAGFAATVAAVSALVLTGGSAGAASTRSQRSPSAPRGAGF
jgi:hypothetical protein